MSDFMADLEAAPFVSSPADTVDELLSQFNNLSAVLDKHAPLVRKRIVVRPDNPWFSTEIAAARREQRRAERAWMKDWIRLRCRHRVPRSVLRASSRVAALVKETRCEFYRKKIAECGRDPKSLARLLDRSVLKKLKPKLPQHDSPSALAGAFLDYFSAKPIEIRKALLAADPTGPDVMFSETSSAGGNPEPFAAFLPLTADQVSAIIKSSPSKSSSALDPLPADLLKVALPVLLPSITRLVNLSLSSGDFPASQKTAIIRPLLKKPNLNPECLPNYRPVSNLSFISKLLERVVLQQLTAHLDDFQLISANQSAYRRGHSTETALLRVTNDLLMAVDSGCAAVLVLLDLSAAFDTVDHTILLKRLQNRYGIEGVAADWIKSFISGRSQLVSLDGVASDSVPLVHGVPQGSVLGPVFFTLYLDPICEIAARHGIGIQLYADDSQLYAIFRLPNTKRSEAKKISDDQSAALARLTSCIDEIKLWMAANRLQLNVAKTDALLAHSGRSEHHIDTSAKLNISGVELPLSRVVKNLGVVLDENLSMEEHVNQVCTSARYHLHRLKRFRRMLDRPTLTQLVCSLVLSRLDYANSLLFGISAELLNKLQRVQNSAAKFVTGASYRDHVTPHLIALHWLPIKQRIEYKIALLVFRCRHGLAPTHLADLLSEKRKGLRSDGDLNIPVSHLVTFGDRAFSIAAPKIWNNLPPALKTCDDLVTFRSGLKTHLFRTAFHQHSIRH